MEITEPRKVTREVMYPVLVPVETKYAELLFVLKHCKEFLTPINPLTPRNIQIALYLSSMTYRTRFLYNTLV
jgi:hypothetical protein